jgi:Domain of unknown function (DUF4198)
VACNLENLKMMVRQCTTQKRAVLAGLTMVSIMVAHSAFAHTPYLLPVTFGVTKDTVSLQAAVTEDDYFVPDFAIKGADYYMISPAGVRSRIDKLTVLNDFSVLEADLKENGTYKLTTGDQGGRITKMAKVDGRWLIVRPVGNAPKAAPAKAIPHAEHTEHMALATPAVQRFIEAAALPAGAQVVEVQSVTRAETYVTKGAPSNGVLKSSGQGFEVKPLTHPNEIYLDRGFSFEVLVDGVLVKGQSFSVYRGGNVYDDKKILAQVKTDSRGRIVLPFERPGVYIMKSSYPAATNVPGIETPASHSYVYSLTFEVAR